MFEDWIKEKQTATDHDIEKDFQIPANTLKKWRLDVNQDSPMHFRLGDKILFPNWVQEPELIKVLTLPPHPGEPIAIILPILSISIDLPKFDPIVSPTKSLFIWFHVLLELSKSKTCFKQAF